MTSFWRIFWLECVSLVRSRALPLLLIASVAWTLVLPSMLSGDGTAEGARAVYVRYALGGVFTLVAVSLVASACASLAREREAKRLQLTLVRPVRFFTIALAKTAALTVAGTFALAVSALCLICRIDPSAPCSHVLKPALPTPRAEAETMYAAYMADTNTPAAVRQAKKSVVIRLLEQKSRDRYETVGTNAVATWKFPESALAAERLAVRFRFSTAHDMRDDLRGTLSFGSRMGVVSNVTQAVLTIPLDREAAGADAGDATLRFENAGKNPVMLRPRRDIELLTPADSFAANLARTLAMLAGALAALVSLGVFLGAGLGRATATFTALAALAVGVASPSVVEQYPDALETEAVDRLGLAITRTVEAVSHPVTAFKPIEDLSENVCVESRQVAETAAADLLLGPILLSLLAAVAMRFKETR